MATEKKPKMTAKEMLAAGYDRSKIKADINLWKPKKKDIWVESSGKIFQINFDKIFQDPIYGIYNRFCVNKLNYAEHLRVYASYIDYFTHNYDEKHELLLAFLKIKFAIDRLHLFNRNNPHALIDLIYEVMFTPTICQAIRDLVEDNYLDDIEREEPDSKYTQPGTKYLESLEFKNKHIKILLRISFGMKLICPILYHYFCVNNIKKPDELKSLQGVSIVYDFYHPLFKLFSDDTNMFNKLFVYIKRKVVDSEFHNSKIFKQQEIYGRDPSLLIHRFIKKQLISENIIKYRFNDQWDPKKKKYKENVIGLNKTINLMVA